jgi:hypothetical protein
MRLVNRKFELKALIEQFEKKLSYVEVALGEREPVMCPWENKQKVLDRVTGWALLDSTPCPF